MCILSTFAIIFVVLGHIRFGFIDMSETGTFYGWFPYYAFHLPVFLFISGYFFKDLRIPEASARVRHGSSPAFQSQSNSQNGGNMFKEIGRFVLRKAKNLLLPYYVVTALFLLFNMQLISWGFTWPQRFTWETWLLKPWTSLYVLTFAVPAWYLIALFLAEMYFLFLRLTIRRLLITLLGKTTKSRANNRSNNRSDNRHSDDVKTGQKNDLLVEVIMLLFTLALGVLALVIHDQPGVSETARVYLRSVLMLFFMQTGLLYRRHFEKRDNLGNVPYFLIIIIVQFLILLLSEGSLLSPGLYGLVGFEPYGYDYFLGGITGIALFLRISRILASTAKRSRLILFISENTKYIMEFHVFGFFLLNALFSVLSKTELFSPFLSVFRNARWHSYLYYTLFDNPRMIPFYLIAGIGISLIIAKIMQVIKTLVRKKRILKSNSSL